MRFFQCFGDSLHVGAILILLLKILKTRSCAGISGKSQLLYAIVFTTRYIDVFTVFISIYNTLMKILFIVASYGTVYLIFIKLKDNYDRSHDTMRIEFLLIPTALLSLSINYGFNMVEVLWAFSIYLEAVAMLPQLFMITRIGETESLMSWYLFTLATYRAFYVLNWIHRYYTEDRYDPIAIGGGVVQLIVVFLAAIFSVAFLTHKDTVEIATVEDDFRIITGTRKGAVEVVVCKKPDVGVITDTL